MLRGKLLAECYFWAWMTLHPEYLLKRLLRLIIMGTLILAPLIAMNWHLVDRGIQPHMPSRSIDLGDPENGR